MTATEFLQQWLDDDNFVTVHTSGSTGAPKSIRLSKHDMCISARATNRFFDLANGARFVCPMSFDYIGARMMLVRSLECSGTLDIIKPSNTFTFNGFADLVAIVPSQVDALIAAPGTAANVIIGGAPLDTDRRQRLIAAGINAYTTYGMTETASHIALAHITDDVYHTLPGIRVSTDSRNCLVIDMEGRDTSHIVTNDIATVLSDSTFRWIGRYDNIINSGGIKICPEEIEAVAADVLTQADIPFTALMLVARPSAKWGTEAELLVETRDDLPADLRDRLKAALPDPRKAPVTITATATLPRTPSGKLRRPTATP